MDAETAAMIAQMMADLGTARRDEVSAPLADGKGRPIQEDSRRERAVQADVEARRAKTLKASAAGGDRGAKMRAWNSELLTFELFGIIPTTTRRTSCAAINKRWPRVPAERRTARTFLLAGTTAPSAGSDCHE